MSKSKKNEDQGQSREITYTSIRQDAEHLLNALRSWGPAPAIGRAVACMQLVVEYLADEPDEPSEPASETRPGPSRLPPWPGRPEE